MVKKKNFVDVVIIAAILITVILGALFDWNEINSYEMYNTSTLDYVSGKVVSVESENLVKDTLDEDRYYGVQELKVLIQEGDYKGQTLDIVNYLSNTSNVLAEEGMKVIICVDMPENAEPYFTVYNYDRSNPLAFILLMFAAAMIVVGGKKGIRAMVGLIFTMAVILLLLVQGIYHGLSVIPLTLCILLLVTLASVYILNGRSRKTLLFAAATVTGLMVAAVFCEICQMMLKAGGYLFSETESLILIAQNTGLQVQHLLFAGVLISSLGAVMDVGVSIVSALYEVKRANPSQSRKDIFFAGMNIGKDMIGTMSNTLILAFTGTSLTTMLLLLAFGYQAEQLLNSNYFIMEIVRGISSTFAVIMTVPAASAVAAAFIREKDVMLGTQKSCSK